MRRTQSLFYHAAASACRAMGRDTSPADRAHWRMSRRARYDTPRKVQLRRVLHMSLEASLVGHVTQPVRGTIEAADIRPFSDPIGATKPLFHDPPPAQHIRL